MKNRRTMWLFAFATLVVASAAIAYVRFLLPFLPPYGKASIGTAGRNSYVITSGATNAALCDGASWKGRSSATTETVSCQGSQIKPFDLNSMLARSLIFHFTPERIYIFDVESFSGGYYLRRIENAAQPGSQQDAAR